MENYAAGSITTNGIEVPIQVDTQGYWKAEYAGHQLAYETREKLENRLKNLTRKTKTEVAVPVTRISVARGWGKVSVSRRRGVATGLHAGNGNVTVSWEADGRRAAVKEQIVTGYGSSSDTLYVGGDVTDEQVAEYGRLLEAKRVAVEAVSAWEKAHEIRVKKVVEAAIEAKAGGED